jgi:hypothetical protein
MKSKLIYLLLIIVVTTMVSCSCSELEKDTTTVKYEKFLGGNHILRKINVKDKTESHASGSYFLIMGGFSASTKTYTTVRFYFLNNKGEFQFMEKLIDEVNIKIDSTVTQPYVTFEWGEYYSKPSYECVTKVIVHCKDSEFKPEININDLK